MIKKNIMTNFNIIILIMLFSFNTWLVAQRIESNAENDSVFSDLNETSDELNDNLSKLKDAGEKSKELAKRAETLEDKYDKLYFEYCNAIDANLNFQFKSDSLSNHTDFLKQSINAIRQSLVTNQCPALSSGVSGIHSGMAQMQKSFGWILVVESASAFYR